MRQVLLAQLADFFDAFGNNTCRRRKEDGGEGKFFRARPFCAFNVIGGFFVFHFSSPVEQERQHRRNAPGFLIVMILAFFGMNGPESSTHTGMASGRFSLHAFKKQSLRGNVQKPQAQNEA